MWNSKSEADRQHKSRYFSSSTSPPPPSPTPQFPGKSEGGSPGRDTTTLTMSPYGGALNVPSLFPDSASRIPKSDPMEGRLQVHICPASLILMLNQIFPGHAALQHGEKCRAGSGHPRRLQESQRAPLRSQYRATALRKVRS